MYEIHLNVESFLKCETTFPVAVWLELANNTFLHSTAYERTLALQLKTICSLTLVIYTTIYKS